MSGQFRSARDFLWPGTQVLRKTLGLREQAALDAAERVRTFGRLIELQSAPLPARFDLAHLQAVHRHLFQDVYAWAGQLRGVPLAKGDTMFCRPEYIGSYAEDVFTRLAGKDLLRNLDTCQHRVIPLRGG